MQYAGSFIDLIYNLRYILISIWQDMPTIRAGSAQVLALSAGTCQMLSKEDIMEISNVILNAISMVGFPIVVAAAMFWKMNKQDDDHKEEMAKVTEAINNNTIALQKLIDKLG